MFRRRFATSTLLRAYLRTQPEHEVGEVVEVARRGPAGRLNELL